MNTRRLNGCLLSLTLIACLVGCADKRSAVAEEPAAEAEPASGVQTASGELVVGGESIALKHAIAMTQTISREDPVYYVLLTEKPAGSSLSESMGAHMGKSGAAVGIHLHTSGKVVQVEGFKPSWLHPAVNPNWSVRVPPTAIQISNLQITTEEVSGTLSTQGEVETEGHMWTLDIEFHAPISADR